MLCIVHVYLIIIIIKLRFVPFEKHNKQELFSVLDSKSKGWTNGGANQEETLSQNK